MIIRSEYYYLISVIREWVMPTLGRKGAHLGSCEKPNHRILGLVFRVAACLLGENVAVTRVCSDFPSEGD